MERLFGSCGSDNLEARAQTDGVQAHKTLAVDKMEGALGALLRGELDWNLDQILSDRLIKLVNEFNTDSSH